MTTTPAQHAQGLAVHLQNMGIVQDSSKPADRYSWFCGSDLRNAGRLVRRYQKVFGVDPKGFNISGGIIGLTH